MLAHSKLPGVLWCTTSYINTRQKDKGASLRGAMGVGGGDGRDGLQGRGNQKPSGLHTCNTKSVQGLESRHWKEPGDPPLYAGATYTGEEGVGTGQGARMLHENEVPRGCVVK
jgi:hypothetical protein